MGCITLINAAQDSILDHAGLISSAAMDLTGDSQTWEAAAPLLALMCQNRLVGLVEDVERNNRSHRNTAEIRSTPPAMKAFLVFSFLSPLHQTETLVIGTWR